MVLTAFLLSLFGGAAWAAAEILAAFVREGRRRSSNDPSANARRKSASPRPAIAAFVVSFGLAGLSFMEQGTSELRAACLAFLVGVAAAIVAGAFLRDPADLSPGSR